MCRRWRFQTWHALPFPFISVLSNACLVLTSELRNRSAAGIGGQSSVRSTPAPGSVLPPGATPRLPPGQGRSASVSVQRNGQQVMSESGWENIELVIKVGELCNVNAWYLKDCKGRLTLGAYSFNFQAEIRNILMTGTHEGHVTGLLYEVWKDWKLVLSCLLEAGKKIHAVKCEPAKKEKNQKNRKLHTVNVIWAEPVAHDSRAPTKVSLLMQLFF